MMMSKTCSIWRFVYQKTCQTKKLDFFDFCEKRQMQLVLLIIMVAIKMLLAETVTQLGQFYLQKSTICWPGWPALFEIIPCHYMVYIIQFI